MLDELEECIAGQSDVEAFFDPVFYELLAHARKTPDVNQVLYPIVCQEIMAYFMSILCHDKREM